MESYISAHFPRAGATSPSCHGEGPADMTTQLELYLLGPKFIVNRSRHCGSTCEAGSSDRLPPVNKIRLRRRTDAGQCVSVIMRRISCIFIALLPLCVPQLSFPLDDNVTNLAAANNAFAFKLLKQLNADTNFGNLFVSPYSAATALQMAANGASGETRAEMQQVLETAGLSPDELNAAIQAAGALLNSSDTGTILTSANALWYRQGPDIRPEFLAENRKFFASTIKPLDFANVPAAKAAINQWASGQTHGRITGIANGLIDSNFTDLVLVNAIYFKGKWLDSFDAKFTRARPFHSATGVTRDVPMMELSDTFAYNQGSDYQAVRLPYQGRKLTMYVFLPDRGSSPTKLLQVLNGDIWQRETTHGFTERHAVLMLPKFQVETSFDLVPPLQNLGMRTAFDLHHANFSGMFNDRHYISGIRQKTFVDVAEEGTEAAAVTAADVRLLEQPFMMIVNRPFLFVIADVRSKMILFMGIVNEL